MGDISDIIGNDNVDETNVATGEGGTPVPAGWYRIMIDSAEIKDTQAMTGKYINIKATIVEGEFENRNLYNKIHLMNPSVKCVEISERLKNALWVAIGEMKVDGCYQLLGKVVEARVKINKDNFNDITAYRAVGSGSDSPASAPVATQSATAEALAPQTQPQENTTPAAPQQPAANKMPWEK